MKKVKMVIGLVMMLCTVVVIAGCGSSSSADTEKKDTLATIKENGKLVVGTSPDFPPMEFYILEDGKKKIVGSDMALAQAIADEIGVDLEIKGTDFNGVLANIQSGKIDLGISGFSQTKEREKVMDFSTAYDQATSEGFQGLLVTKETASKYKSLDELKEANLKLGAQSGSIQYELAMDLTEASNIKQYGTTDAAYLALNAGDLDAVVVSTDTAKPALKTFDNLEILPQESFDLDPDGYYAKNVIGIPKSEENESLIKVVNKVIKESVDNGNYKEWQAEALEQSKNAVDTDD
ncbi:MAG: transporter substrate-binding domain-containing protein [Enterococcus sp.]